MHDGRQGFILCTCGIKPLPEAHLYKNTNYIISFAFAKVNRMFGFLLPK
jgi:hypothetical protein